MSGAVAATVCSLGLLYVSVILWVAWSNPPFDLSGMDGELVLLDRQHGVSVLWPVICTSLAMLAVVLAAISWGCSRHGHPPAPVRSFDDESV